MGVRIMKEDIVKLPGNIRKQILQAELSEKKELLQSTAKVKCDEKDSFDSEGEREYYNYLLLRERNGEVLNIKRQVKFSLVEPFTNSSGKYIEGITYTADFTYIDNVLNKEVIVEVKARKRDHIKVDKLGKAHKRKRSVTDTEASRLRWKLLQYKFRGDKTKLFVKWYRGESFEVI